MCGVIGVISTDRVADDIYKGLVMLQHRGQDSAGILTFDGRFHLKKGSGLVNQIFDEKKISKLTGNIGLGHTRYPTVGTGCAEDAQPFKVNSPYGIGIIHNGNVSNFCELKKEIINEGLRHINSNCDVEIILNIFADELSKEDINNFKPENVFKAVERVFNRVKGSFSVVGVIAGKGMFSFRDPHGIKPLIFGKKGDSYMFASESVSLDVAGYDIERDVLHGEAIFIDNDLKFHSKRITEKEHHPCIFEYVYFARPDSIIDKISVYKARLRMGTLLGEDWLKTGKKADVIIPVPDTSRAAALSMSERTNIKYREGLIKNRYIGRTFIMPGQKIRKDSIRHKLNPIELEINGKEVLLIDDSVVRGNTSKKIISLVREAGAKNIYFGIYSSPIKFPCVYGIDMATKKDFIAKGHSVEEIKELIGADFVMYQKLENMIVACKEGNPSICKFCTACFTGDYPTGDVTPEMLEKIEHERLSCHNDN